MWLSISGEQWRITAIEDKMLLLEKGFEDEPATMQIDLSKAKWTKYVEAAVAVLETLNQENGPGECHDSRPDSPRGAGTRDASPLM
jgi:hypothetical protein